MTTSPKSGSRGTRKATWELEAAGVSAASSTTTRQMTAISLRLVSTFALIYCTQLDRLEQATGNQPAGYALPAAVRRFHVLMAVHTSTVTPTIGTESQYNGTASSVITPTPDEMHK